MKSPLAEVTDRFGSKEKLAEELFKLLPKGEEESKEEFKERLMRVPNRKLLHIHAVEERTKALGGKEKLVDAIVAAHKRAKDGDWRKALLAKPNTELLDLVRAAQKLEKRGGRRRGDAPLALERARRKRRRQKLHAARAARKPRSA